MPNDNSFFNDFYKLAGSAMNTAFGTAADMKKQFDDMIDSKVNILVAKYKLVSREEFEVVRKMAQTARENQEKLEAKITELEKKLNAK